MNGFQNVLIYSFVPKSCLLLVVVNGLNGFQNVLIYSARFGLPFVPPVVNGFQNVLIYSEWHEVL